jgi:bifunctional UDP-N-acetylglucosamine pyrophosphorylase/glucosamine-1-phosphate N-acetyltransferase
MVAVAILAAGRGTRMKSEYPKVLHELGGKSLVERALLSCASVNPSKHLAIVGYQAERVKASLTDYENLEFVEQKEQLGTGHAIQQLLPYLKDFQGDLLVLNGDVPLLRSQTIAQLWETHKKHQNAATLLTAQLPNPRGYGRVFCDNNHYVQQIVEDRDCTAAQKQNCRINGGIYCFNWQQLAKILPDLKADNDQKEYYITDVFAMMQPVMAVDVEDYQEITGINDRRQLANAYQILQARIKDAWMAAGVTLIDPDSITIDDTVTLHPDTTIEPQTHLRGKTEIGSGCRIGPGSLIENSTIDDDVTVLYSVISDSEIDKGTRVGPYAHLRGQVKVGKSCRVGNFVELKKTSLGEKTKSPICPIWEMPPSAIALTLGLELLRLITMGSINIPRRSTMAQKLAQIAFSLRQ